MAARQEEIRQWIGCDALIYQDVEAMKQAVGQVNPAVAGLSRPRASMVQYITGDISDEAVAIALNQSDADGEDDAKAPRACPAERAAQRQPIKK